MNKIVIIGSGFGGLSAAAELSRRGFEVDVLEAHIYPGGSAGTFFHKGYRFDAGASGLQRTVHVRGHRCGTHMRAGYR